MNSEHGAVLYKRFLDGDESAFEEILNVYRNSLTFFINRFVNNVDIAEDIAADVFAYIIFKPKKYNFKVSLKTYLFMIGRSRALDWIRKESRRKSVSLESLDFEMKDESKTLEEAVIANEEKRRLYIAMEALSEDYKTAIHLVYFENLTYEEAAKVMGKNKKQIENFVYRAKKALKAIMTEDEK